MRARRPLAVALMTMSALAACQSHGRIAKPSPYTPMYEGLCSARAKAADPAAARTVFFDRAHQPVHELAAEASKHDRPAAARLLEAKEAVERDLDSADRGRLATDLDRLVGAARTAIQATGGTVPDDCGHS